MKVGTWVCGVILYMGALGSAAGDPVSQDYERLLEIVQEYQFALDGLFRDVVQRYTELLEQQREDQHRLETEVAMRFKLAHFATQEDKRVFTQRTLLDTARVHEKQLRESQRLCEELHGRAEALHHHAVKTFEEFKAAQDRAHKPFDPKKLNAQEREMYDKMDEAEKRTFETMMREIDRELHESRQKRRAPAGVSKGSARRSGAGRRKRANAIDMETLS